MSKIDNYNVDDLIKEADKAVSDENWTTANSKCPEIYKNNSSNYINWVTFFGGFKHFVLTTYGLPLVSPVGWGVAAIAAGKTIKNENKKQETKLMAYKILIEKQNAVIKALQNEAMADDERIESLTRLNELLTEAIKKLQEQ